MKFRILIFIFITILSAATCREARSFLFWNQAAHFNGTTGYVAFPNSASLNITGSFCIEAWINPVNSLSPASQVIIEKRTGTLANGYTLFLQNGRVAIRTNSIAPKLIGNIIIPGNTWTHISGTYNASSNVFSIYVNNIHDSSVTIAGSSPVSNPDSLKIGRGNVGSPFNGFMDEVRIWSKELTAAEVSQFFRTSLGASTGIYSSLVLSVTFQDKESTGVDTSLFDWSSNNGNGNNNNLGFLDLGNRPSTTVTPNESVNLDGVNDYISAVDNSNVSPTAGVTLEAWIFPKTVSALKTIIFKGVAGGSAVNYRLRLSGTFLNATIDGNSTPTSPVAILLNAWTHVAFTYDGASESFVFYVNGNRAGSGALPVGTITDGADSLLIGSDKSSGSNFFGLIDEVRISNYAKTQVDIQRFIFQSIDNANEPNAGLLNVCYNLDGYAFDNADSGPRLNFISGAGFSHAGATDNQVVSPLNRQDEMKFSDGFNMKSSEKRIPLSGISGIVEDSFNVCLDTLITDINVFIAINHQAEEELEIQLVAPNGESVTVYDNQSLVSNSDNIVTVFDDQADSSVTNNGRYVSFAPSIKPKNSLNAVFNGDNTGGVWRLVVKDLTGSGIGRISGWGIQFNNASLKLPALCLKVFMEGFYREDDSTIVDSVKTHIIESVTMEEVGVAGETPDLDNFVRYNYPDADYAETYYLQVRHRNSIQIWSANPIAFDFAAGNIIYDFTISQDSAFGSNQVQVDDVPLRFAMYGGDVNQDDNVNLSDILLVTNDANLFTIGYVVTDVTGDNTVNLNDVLLTTNNSTNFIIAIVP